MAMYISHHFIMNYGSHYKLSGKFSPHEMYRLRLVEYYEEYSEWISQR